MKSKIDLDTNTETGRQLIEQAYRDLFNDQQELNEEGAASKRWVCYCCCGVIVLVIAIFLFLK